MTHCIRIFFFGVHPIVCVRVFQTCCIGSGATDDGGPGRWPGAGHGFARRSDGRCRRMLLRRGSVDADGRNHTDREPAAGRIRESPAAPRPRSDRPVVHPSTSVVADPRAGGAASGSAAVPGRAAQAAAHAVPANARGRRDQPPGGHRAPRRRAVSNRVSVPARGAGSRLHTATRRPKFLAARLVQRIVSAIGGSMRPLRGHPTGACRRPSISVGLPSFADVVHSLRNAYNPTKFTRKQCRRAVPKRNLSPDGRSMRNRRSTTPPAYAGDYETPADENDRMMPDLVLPPLMQMQWSS